MADPSPLPAADAVGTCVDQFGDSPDNTALTVTLYKDVLSFPVAPHREEFTPRVTNPDADGAYTFVDVPPGTYSVTCALSESAVSTSYFTSNGVNTVAPDANPRPVQLVAQPEAGFVNVRHCLCRVLLPTGHHGQDTAFPLRPSGRLVVLARRRRARPGEREHFSTVFHRST